MTALPTVLVVDDDPDLRATYAQLLGERYDCRVAADGTDALASVDGTEAVALVDRQLPDRSGLSVVEALADAAPHCRTALVTGEPADYAIVDAPLDAYLRKPVPPVDLREAVDALLERGSCSPALREHLALATKHAALAAQRPRAERERHPAFVRLQRRLAETRPACGLPERRLDSLLVDDAARRAAKRLSRHPG